MVHYKEYQLKNGLNIILHQDKTTPFVSVNLLYNVGARDENPNKTGFAHLFEHLMFGGSKNIPSYDTPVEQAGGENNAFTNNDITNYYLTVPRQFLEMALWLESDRMNELAFSKKSLDVQRNVVSEEFKQRYLNQPYGDIWLLLRPLAYKVHPYQWCTIGKELSHIENATLEDVKAFFYKFYRPNNAILSIAGNLEYDETISLIEKWFSGIPSGEEYKRNLPEEPLQIEERKLFVEREVPANAIYKAFPMCKRMDKDYYIFDLISDILSNGKSSRLYNRLVKDRPVFNEINAFISGDADNGLFVVTGKLQENVSFETADEAIFSELNLLKTEAIGELELQKVKNKVETNSIFAQYKALDRAMNLAYYKWLGDIELINTEAQKYQEVTAENICKIAEDTFQTQKCSTLYYQAK